MERSLGGALELRIRAHPVAPEKFSVSGASTGRCTYGPVVAGSGQSFVALARTLRAQSDTETVVERPRVLVELSLPQFPRVTSPQRPQRGPRQSIDVVHTAYSDPTSTRAQLK